MVGHAVDQRVFITHSSVDKELAEAIVAYIRSATGLKPSQVFCTSIDGQGVPTGADFMAFIRRQLRSTKLVVPLITPAYLDSVFCQWELGAVWARETRVVLFPLRVRNVSHEVLPGPLRQIQVAEINSAGLAELVRRVAEVFKVDVYHPQARSAETALLRRLPKLLRALAKRWDQTEQAKLRRAARHASGAKHLHQVLHTQRDAGYVLAVNERLTPEVADQFLGKLTEVSKELASYFTEVTGRPCRVTLKQFLALEDENYVEDLARSAGQVQAGQRDAIPDNTDFELILREDGNHYMSNDLVQEIKKGYRNSHGVPGKNLSYRSTIVWPIRKTLSSPDVAKKIRSPLLGHHLLGFLCVDAAAADTFDLVDFEIGAGIADSLYSVLRPYFDLLGEAPTAS